MSPETRHMITKILITSIVLPPSSKPQAGCIFSGLICVCLFEYTNTRNRLPIQEAVLYTAYGTSIVLPPSSKPQAGCIFSGLICVCLFEYTNTRNRLPIQEAVLYTAYGFFTPPMPSICLYKSFQFRHVTDRATSPFLLFLDFASYPSSLFYYKYHSRFFICHFLLS